MTNSLKHIVEGGGHDAKFDLGFRRNPAKASADKGDWYDAERENDECHDGENCVGIKHDADQDENHKEIPSNAGNDFDNRFP